MNQRYGSVDLGESMINYTKDYLKGRYKICIAIKQIVSIMWMPFYCVWVNRSDTKISFPVFVCFNAS